MKNRALRAAAVAAATILIAGCASDVEPGPDTDPVAAPDPDETEDVDVEPDAPAEDDTVDEPAQDDTGGGELAVGEAGTVGDWTVTIDAVDTDATDEVMAANEFNEDPDGVYVLVTVTATYNGDDEAMASMDLAMRLQGSDGRQYATYDCDASVPDSLTNEPMLVAGGTASGNVCG